MRVSWFKPTILVNYKQCDSNDDERPTIIFRSSQVRQHSSQPKLVTLLVFMQTASIPKSNPGTVRLGFGSWMHQDPGFASTDYAEIHAKGISECKHIFGD